MPSNDLLFLLNIVIISIAQIYIMIKCLQRKKLGTFWGNLVTYIIIVLLLLYEYYLDSPIPGFIITCSIVTIIGHTLIGKYFDIYHKSKTYDRYLHFFGSFSFSLLIFAALNCVSKLDNKLYIFLIVFTLGTTLGVFFEILEFLHDTFSKKPRSQHGLADTDYDMISNLIGSFVAGIVAVTIY